MALIESRIPGIESMARALRIALVSRIGIGMDIGCRGDFCAVSRRAVSRIPRMPAIPDASFVTGMRCSD